MRLEIEKTLRQFNGKPYDSQWEEKFLEDLFYGGRIEILTLDQLIEEALLRLKQ